MRVAWGTSKSHPRTILLAAVVAREREMSARAYFDWLIEHCWELPDDYPVPLNRY
jgi:hypothetical protein